MPGHYDHDNVTDFMVKYNAGPGMPLYYYSQATILSGVNGSSLLENMIVDSGGPNNQLAGLSLSQTFGGDFFLYWQVTCRGVSNPKDPYEFVPLFSGLQQARADTCRLRYNATTVLKLYALARHVQPPGAMIFSSGKNLICMSNGHYQTIFFYAFLLSTSANTALLVQRKETF